jgi:hypothetical protein
MSQKESAFQITETIQNKSTFLFSPLSILTTLEVNGDK